MPNFVPDLQNPEDASSIQEWSRRVAGLINGHISIGEPISHDTALFPNGVKAHLLGSFVQVETTANTQSAVCTHNLNIDPKGLSAPPVWNDPLNVGWIIVRVQHDNFGAAGIGGTAAMFHGGAGTVTANSITLEFHLSGHTVAVAHPALWTLWFFPTTR